jgi:hypothetical protein
MNKREFAIGDYVYYRGNLVEIRLQVVDNVRRANDGTYIVWSNGKLIKGIAESELSHEAPVITSMIDRLSSALNNCRAS